MIKKIFSFLLDYFIPSEWKKPIAIAILAGVAGLASTFIIRKVVLEELKASSQHIFDDQQAKYSDIRNQMLYQDDRIKAVSNAVMKQGTKIDRMDGKMDTVIYLLKNK
jgi:hypothetical protein